MTEGVSAACGFCGKRFRLRPEQLGREILCPHCGTVAKVARQTETAREAVEALGDQLAERRPVKARREVVLPRGGVRSRGLTVLWAAFLVLAMIGAVVGLILVYRPHEPPAPQPPPPRPAPKTPPRRVGSAEPPGGFFGVGAGPRAAPSPAPADGAEAEDSGPVRLNVAKLIRGVKGRTVTYAVGTVTNTSTESIPSLEVTVAILDRRSEKVGQARAVIRQLSPGETAPLVATWTHQIGLDGELWVVQYDIDSDEPEGETARLEVAEPWVVPDPSGFNSTGEITALVKNVGKADADALELVATMLNARGKIVGAARQVVFERLRAGEEKEIRIRYEQCPNRLILSLNVRAQPAPAQPRR